MPTAPIIQADAFTDTPFRGNPAAVCLLEREADEAWMQNVAAEMNLAETAFLVPRDGGFDLRWFTPATEVDMCGHATLASAHVLWEEGRVAPDEPCRFHTRSGLLTAERDNAWIRMEFPLETIEPTELPPAVAKALGIQPKNTMISSRLGFYLVEVASEDAILRLQPNFPALAEHGRHAFIVTAKATRDGFDFVSRMFAPGFGIDEDPVTGAAHCVLANYWHERLGKSEFMAYQASRRGGVVKVEAAAPKCFLSGQAVTVLRGELLTT